MKTGDGGRSTILDPERKAQLAAELAGDAPPERKRSRPAAEAAEEEEREFTLSTSTLFGLFLGLVLLCGVFFGIGFTMGHRSSQPAAGSQQAASVPAQPEANAAPESAPPPMPATSGEAGAPDQSMSDQSAASENTPYQAPSDQAAAGEAAAGQAAAGQASTVPAPQAQRPAPTISLPVAETPLERKMEGPAQRQARIKRISNPPSDSPAGGQSPALSRQAAASAVSQPAQPGAGGVMVQVAAVARSKDANLLAAALRQKGYAAVVRTSPNDKLLHVQVGPFATRQQANAMRQKLGASGYNAILK